LVLLISLFIFEKKEIMPEEKPQLSPIIKEMEEKYPEMTKEFKKIMREQYEIFCKKQHDYGPFNLSVGTKCENEEEVNLSLTGIWFRLNDKLQRLKQLVVLSKKNSVEESIQDTFSDLSVYGIIAQVITRGKWAK